MEKNTLFDIVNKKSDLCDEIYQFLWNNPEVGGCEKIAPEYLIELFEKNGFKIYREKRMPNAFYAEYGSGQPVIGILGEYDALKGLSQKVQVTKEPIDSDHPEAAGHGCGHNLLGTAGVIAALALKEAIDDGVNGTIRFYGCPEEELLCGKVKMVHYHMFDGCEFGLTWHPNFLNKVHDEAYLANASVRFHFHGITAHAAVAPEKGRSALDAAELMGVGSNYLREHVIDKARIHYTTDSGNLPPNVIPDKATSWYYVRAPHMKDVQDILKRLYKIAEGAALMTETTVDIDVDSGCCELKSTKTFTDITYTNLVEAGNVQYTDEEMEFAQKIEDSLDVNGVERFKKMTGVQTPIHTDVMYREFDTVFRPVASSDVGDVSQIMPVNIFTIATWPLACMAHTWQATAASGSSIGSKGALYAARTMVGIAYDLMTDHNLADKITKEFEAQRNKDYRPMLKNN